MMLKKKAMYILALLFLLIISISSVSAMGINSTDELISENSDLNEEYTVLNENSNEIDQINEINNENNDEVNINSIGENTFLNQNSQDSNSNILTDSQNITVNTKTFAAIQSAIDGANDGDTIVLSGTYSNNMYQPIKINKTLNFIGINNAILDANRYNNIFNVSVQISINDITFKNGKNNDRMYNTGGAISNRVQVTCINCTFVNNAAVSNGAVDFANAINCTFINNSATSGSVGAMVGTARGCIFINNSASENTGAIYLPSSAFLAVNCTFINNSAAKDGGAIFSYSNYNAIDCYFKNNSAQLGGAICANYLGIVNNCSFIGNNASVDGSSIYAKYTPNGPGTAGSFTISECKFINSSDNNLVSVHDASSFYLSNSQFIACNSSNNSNCFVVFDEKIGGTEIFNNSFVNCSFKSNGGILHLNYTFPQSINISGCTFEKISFNDNTGLFHSNRRNIYFDNCSFINLDLKDNVSIKLVEGSSPTNLINCYFKNNQVFNGTILDFNKYNFPFGDCYFINNTVKYGSLIFVGDDLSYLRNFNFENNTVYNYTLIDFKGSNCSLANCSFIENSAKDSGVLNFDNVSLCNLVDCYFEANNASNFGGAIYSKNSILNIEKCIFNDNYATNGGAICANGKNSMLNIKDCTFKDNEGAIFLEELSSSEFYNCSFINNTADKYGGAIYSILSNFTLEKCNLSINGARCPFSSGGGIIYPDVGGAIYSDESNFEINDCDFSANYAFLGYGGDVCVVGISNYSYINNSRFEGSSSDSHNGGIYGNCTINNSNFTAYCSEAIEFGVAINCLFERNYDSVIRNGVAKNCTFVNNDLASIFNSYKSDGVVLNSNITNCTFINNSAKNGGALAFTIENSYEVINCTFINNNATNGGAISIVNASVNIVNSSFENNTCTGSGAAVFIENATEVSIDHCEFVNCVSGDGGESIKTDDIESLNVSDCVFDIVPEMIPIHYSSILLANDFSFALGSNGILIANLSDVRGPLVGKTITLTVNGSDYFNITDSDGLTRFNMNDYFNSVGNYSAILSFSGDDSDSPVSTNVNIDICNYKGVLSVSSLGKYFEDVNISFRLYSLGSIKPISGANLHVMFSNGEFVDLVTGSDGSTSYVLPFAPGIYNLTAVVSDNFVDVNTAKLNNIVISPIEGKIDVTQAENVLNVRLYNPNNGDVYRNLNVTINFNDMDPIVIKTDDHGIASYDMSVLGFGTYSAIVMVTGDYKDFNARRLILRLVLVRLLFLIMVRLVLLLLLLLGVLLRLRILLLMVILKRSSILLIRS